MKKFIAPLLCMGLLCSCADKKEGSVTSVSDENSVTESTTEAVTTEPLSAKSHLSYYINEDCLEILYDDKYIQTIQCDTILKESDITCEDFDFDGYNDLFIPSKLEIPNRPGTYYHYNTETQLFESWNEISELVICAQVDTDNKTLSQTLTGSAAYYDTTVYKWSDAQLLPMSRETQYSIGDDIFIDTYEYDENYSEILIKREKALFDENSRWAGTEEIEIINLMSFLVNEDNINIIRDCQVIQTLECNYPSDENKLIFDDYDFDGYDDLFVSMEHGAMFAPGTYFRYNPESCLFEKWEELNNIGCEMIIIEDKYKLRRKISSSNYWFEYYDYKWENEKLILSEHIISETGEVIEIYSVDKSGKETLINRETNGVSE